MAVVTFLYTGAPVWWVVPPGVFLVEIACWGGRGGARQNDPALRPGAYARGTVAVTPGELLRIRVGGDGQSAVTHLGPVGGFNGGGAGGDRGQANAYAGASGGGASDVRRAGDGPAERIVSAAGAGGSGGDGAGGLVAGIGGAGGLAGTAGASGISGLGGAAGGGGPLTATNGASALVDGGAGGGGGGGGYPAGAGGGAGASGGSGGGGGGGLSYVSGSDTQVINGGNLAASVPKVTLSYNAPPYAPVLGYPSGGVSINRAAPVQFRQTFSDPDTGDSRSRLEQRYRLVGTTTWTTVIQNLPVGYYEYPAGTFAAGDYEWQGRDTDAGLLVGSWSSSEFFTAANAPDGPAITSHVNGATIPTPTKLLTWTGAATATAYQARVLTDLAGDPDAVIFDTGTVPRAAGVPREHLIPYPANNVVRHTEVREFDGLWSDWATVYNPISYATAPPAIVEVVADFPFVGALGVWMTNPPSIGDQPATVSNKVERRRLTAARAEGGVPVVGSERVMSEAYATNFVLADYSVASKAHYEYRASARGDNGTVAVGEWVENLPPENRLLLADPFTNIAGWIAGANTTLTHDTVQGRSGLGTARLVATAAGSIRMISTRPQAARFGPSFPSSIWLRDGGTLRQARHNHLWYDEDGVLIQTDLGPLVSEIPTPVDPGTPAVTFDLLYSTSPLRTSPEPLDGATLSGEVAIFTSEADVSQVAFSIDGVLHRTDTTAPFDFEGGSISSAVLLDVTTLSPGVHEVTAVITRASGGTETLEATVIFAAPGTPAQYRLQASDVAGSQAGPTVVDLEGEVVDRPISIFLTIEGTPAQAIDHVTLYRDETFIRDDPAAPYTLKPNGGLVDLIEWGVAGDHSATIEIVWADESVTRVAAEFTVPSVGGGGGGGSAPPVAWLADFETDFAASIGTIFQQETGDSITIDTSAPLQGTRSCKINCTGPRDYGAYGSLSYGMRSEIRAMASEAMNVVNGTVQHYGIKIRVATNAAFPATGKFLSIMQFHGGVGSPILAFEMLPNGNLFAYRRGGGDGSKTHPSYSQATATLLSPFVRGTDYDFRIETRWSTGADGYQKIWVDEVLKATMNGPTRYSTNPYWKAGWYGDRQAVSRDMWVDCMCRADTAEAIIAQLAKP